MKKMILLAALAFGTLGLVSYRTGATMEQLKKNGIQDQGAQCFTYVIYYQPRRADGTIDMSKVRELERGFYRSTLFGVAMYVDNKVAYFVQSNGYNPADMVSSYLPINCFN